MRLGITVLHEDPDALLDIVFVHGLNGDPENTWRHKNGLYWPRDLLKVDLPKTRIMTFGYDATSHRFLNSVSQGKLDIYAQDLLAKLMNERSQAKSAERKICFVAHSLGGLVVANALTQPNVANQSKIERHTIAVQFLGVPLHGSNSATFAIYLGNLAKLAGWKLNSDLLRDLRPHSDKLLDVRIRFIARLREREDSSSVIHLTCYHELIKTEPVGLIVPRDSAISEGHSNLSINANHTGMTKFPDGDDPGYRGVISELKLRVNELKSHKVGRNTTNLKSAAPTIINSGSNNTERNLLVGNVVNYPSFNWSDAKRSKSPTPRCIGLPKNNTRFIGRETYLRKIHEMFDAEEWAVALVGLAGIGKSRLAIKFGYNFYEQSPKPWVFWVQAGNRTQLEKGYKDIADALDIPHPPDADILERVRDHMRNKIEERWLLIVDNVDDPTIFAKGKNEGLNSKSLRDFLPCCPHGSVLITSCCKKLEDTLVESCHVITVEEMTELEAIELLERKSRNRRTYSDEDKITLSKALDYIPLAIVQAAGFLNQQKFISIENYLEKLKSTGAPAWADHLDLVGRPNEGYETRKPIIKTLQIQFEYLWEEYKGAANLMSQMSFCDRQSIPDILFKDKPCFEENVQELIDHSLIDPKEAEIYTMHSLVQGAVRAWLVQCNESEEQMKCLITKICEEFPARNFADEYKLCRGLFQHIEEVFTIKPEVEPNFQYWNVLLYGGTSFARYNGEIKIALKFIEKMVERCKRTSQRDGLFRIGLLVQGGLLRQTRKWAEAEMSLRQAEEMNKELKGDPAFTSWVLTGLMSLYIDWGKVDKVLELQKQLERMQCENIAEIMRKKTLANSYEFQRQWDEAEKKRKEVVELSKGIADESRRRQWYTGVFISLYHTYKSQGKYGAAINLINQELDQGTFRAEDDVTHELMYFLAEAQYYLKDYSSAMDTLIRIRNERQDRGAGDRILGHTEHLLICTNYALGTLNGAGYIAQLLKEEECCSHDWGNHHRNTLSLMHFNAKEMKSQGLRADAISKMRICYERRKEAIGEEHPLTQESLSFLRVWEEEQQQIAQKPSCIEPVEEDSVQVDIANCSTENGIAEKMNMVYTKVKNSKAVGSLIRALHRSKVLRG